MQKICLIIPCYNEEKRLREKDFFDLLQVRADTSLCFVNDGSSDATHRVLDTFRHKNPDRIMVLSLEKNSGKAEAVRRGVMHISAMSNFDFIGYWDADISTPLGELEHILAAFRMNPACRLAMGSRMKRLGSVIERRAMRHVMGRVFSTFASWILRLPVYDSQCGAKVFRSDTATVLFGEPFITKWLFDVEVIARLRNHLGKDQLLGSTIEVPLNAWLEVGGSKLRLKHFIKVPFDLLKINSYYNKK